MPIHYASVLSEESEGVVLCTTTMNGGHHDAIWKYLINNHFKTFFYQVAESAHKSKGKMPFCSLFKGHFFFFSKAKVSIFFSLLLKEESALLFDSYLHISTMCGKCEILLIQLKWFYSSSWIISQVQRFFFLGES